MTPPNGIEAEIRTLLEEAEQGSDTVRDLAATCLRQFRQECQVVIDWQCTEGREQVFQGEDPDFILAETQWRVGEARRLLKERLEKLLTSAHETGF